MKLNELVERSKRLRQNPSDAANPGYLDRHAFWTRDLQEGDPLRDLLVNVSYQPAMEFLRVRDEKVIPALLRGERAKAREIALTELKPAYEEHRAAVDQIVRMATQRFNEDNQKLEAADTIIAERTRFLVGLGIGILSIVERAGIDYMITGSVAASHHGMPRATQDLDIVVELSADEVGELLRRMIPVR